MKCNVCQSNKVDIYGRALNTDVSSHEETDSLSAMAELSPSYIQCSQCLATIWGVDVGWYPYLTVDKERWRMRYIEDESKPNISQAAKAKMVESIPLEVLEQLLKARMNNG